MGIITTYECDACKAQRRTDKETWWLVLEEIDALHIRPLFSSTRPRVGEYTICGRSCVQKLVERFLERFTSNGTTDSESDRVPTGADSRG